MRRSLLGSSLLVALLLEAPGCAPSDAPPPLDAGAASDAPPSDAPRVGRDAGAPPDDLEGFVDWWMAEGGIYGLAAAVVENGELVLTLTRGMATETQPVDEHTLFIVASVSKTFCGALLLQLAEEGRLDLDADVSDYLGFSLRHPSFPDVVITTRMLATHTSGLVDSFVDLGTVSYSDADPTMTLREFAEDYTNGPSRAAHWGTRAPGTAYAYSNAGFGVLGAIVEAASGEDFRARSAARLFGPLALDGAGWFLADVDPTRLADEFAWSRRGGFERLAQHGFAFYPASSLRISVVGMARWIRAHVDGTLEGTTFLSPDSITLTRTPLVPGVVSDRGFVWERDVIAGRTFWGHSGSTFGASANVYVRDDGDGVVLLTNSDAYVRSRFGESSGTLAMRAILERLTTHLAP